MALTGQRAPGTASGVYYSNDYFGSPVLNDTGQTAFRAAVTGSNVTGSNFLGIWSEGSGNLGLLARLGDQVPGTPAGVTYRSDAFSALVLNDAGQTAFSATFFGNGVDATNDSGLVLQRSGSLVLVARERSQAVGAPVGELYDFLSSSLLNNAGQTAFSSVIRGNGLFGLDNSGIWSEGSGSLALLVRNGDQATGTSLGVTYTTPVSIRPFETPVLNYLGQTAFRAGLAGSGVDGSNNFGIWSGTPGNLKLVARAGDPAPGTPAGVIYRGNVYPRNTFDSPALNNAGQIAFRAGLTGSGVDSTNDEGIWAEGSGNVELVARKGGQAPGMSAGVIFNNFSTFPLAIILNSVGQTAFYAGLSGGGMSGGSIWSEGLGSLAVVAHRGGQAPGTPTGVMFADFDLRSLVLNDAGQTAFVGSLNGSGVNDTNDKGIWATDRSGALQLIAREGDLLEVAPGEFRTIYSFDFVGGTGNGDGRPSGFNNRGQLAFHARFTDGWRGIFVSNLVAVPEPHSLLLLALGLVGADTLRRRRRL